MRAKNKLVRGIYVDRHISDQVNWWCEVGQHLCRWKVVKTIVRVADNETLGWLIEPKGLLAKYVMNKNDSFIKGEHHIHSFTINE